MFKEALQELVERTEGGLAGLLMDSSGIALESYTKDGSSFDINTIGIEFSVVIGSIKRASEMLEAGAANEIAVGTDRLVTIIRTLGDTYFLALAMRPDGNFGKGRYLMRTAAPKLIAEL
jgi:predicted regulator of Ras-like GTPase activity (Roadblock/LC7/MglB family)